jgi:regulator of replication initiation timing
MKELDILTAQINLRTLDQALTMSIDDLKTKHAHRVDLINPMELRQMELKEAMLTFYRVCEDHKQVVKKYYSVFEENLRLRTENTELKKFI